MNADNVTSSDITSYTLATYEIHEIVFILFCIIGITCDVITIYTILRFKKLQSANNIYIANWALIDITSLILTPTAYSIIVGLDHISSNMGFTSACIKLGVLLHSGCIAAMLLVAFEWNLAAYFPNVSEAFQRFTRDVLVVFWLVIGICGTLSMVLCGNFELCVIDGITLIVSIGILGVYVLILNIWRGVKKYRNTPMQYSALSLNLATAFVFIWTVGFYNIAHLRWSLENPLLSLIADCFTFSSPVINFVILYKCDTSFKECVRKVFKRPQKDADNYYQFRNPIVINKNILGNCAINIPKEQI